MGVNITIDGVKVNAFSTLESASRVARLYSDTPVSSSKRWTPIKLQHWWIISDGVDIADETAIIGDYFGEEAKRNILKGIKPVANLRQAQ